MINMGIDTYQELAKKTAHYKKQDGINYCILAMNGEAGEIANKYKKFLRGDFDDAGKLDLQNFHTGAFHLVKSAKLLSLRASMIDELGDVLWYVSQLAEELGIPLSAVASQNLLKLSDRQRKVE